MEKRVEELRSALSTHKPKEFISVSSVSHSRVSLTAGLGKVEFSTSDVLPLQESRKIVFVHPWIRDVRGGDGDLYGQTNRIVTRMQTK